VPVTFALLDFVRETQTLIAAALLLGMDHASRKLNAADEEIPPLPFEKAVSFMKSRIPMTKTEWGDLEPKLRFRAFTVARLAECDYIDAARQVLYKAMETGKGIGETYKQWQTLQTLIQDDAMKLRSGYWENVYRTNTQTAYTAGKLMQFKDNPPPAWRLLIIDDDRTSDICRGLMRDGKQSLTMASDHPFWETFGFPPYHFQCRTGLQAVYKSEIGQGTTIENPSMKSLRKQFEPMDGFGGNPVDKESWWKITGTMIERATKYGIWPDILQQTADLDMLSYQNC
jgi:SPP1 gp7 family putative phage head morphogenesis protein